MSTLLKKEVKKVTTQTLRLMKMEKRKISFLTAYDYSFAKIIDQAGIDAILVGDSASNVFCGNESTLPITLDEMIYHAKSVVKAVNRALVIVDLPFGSYQGNSKEALSSAIRVMKETGAHGIKLEGGETSVEAIQRITSAGIPVMGHLGLTPQSIYKFGTYTIRAKEEEEEKQLLIDSKLIEKAGCFAFVIEKVPSLVAKKVTESVNIPTIGIGAGPETDGQVLVMHDLLGINKEFNPRFIRKYADLNTITFDAVKNYVKDVTSKDFPNEKESY